MSLSAPDGNKFLFAQENKLVQNSWPASVAKMLGKHSLALKVGDEHKYVKTHFNPFLQLNNSDQYSYFVNKCLFAQAHIQNVPAFLSSLLKWPISEKQSDPN